MKKALMASALFLNSGIATSPALAQDGQAAFSPSDIDWTGFYAGAHIGNVGDEYKLTSIDAGPNFWGAGQVNLSGIDELGGLQVGYWWQQSDIVYGIDAQYSAANISSVSASPVYPAEDTWAVDVERITLIQARVGWVKNQWLFFGQAGYAGVDGTATATYVGTPNIATDSKWHNGWTLGVGAAYRASENLSIGAEYNYVDTSSKTYNWGGCADCFGSESASVDHDMHLFKLNINYHF